MPTIDNLDIQIKAQSTSAINSIDKLIGGLERLQTSLSSINGGGISALASGVSQLASSMETMKTIDSRNFGTLAKNIEKLGNINHTGLYSTASALNSMSVSFKNVSNVSDNTKQILGIASAIGKLGSKSVERAIVNIPLLAKSLNELMVTLSKSPQVSNNLIKMTNALANLSSQGAKVGSTTRSLTNSFGTYTRGATKATKSTFSLATAFGKFYATYFLAIRGIRKLGDAVKSSMDYVETLNYFKSAFNQVAETADLSGFEKAGYKSAEAYAKSFEEEAKKLTSTMSGFNINDDGTLTETRMKNLGMNPNELMNYQAMFAQMSSSMGTTAEQATTLSRVLTEIGADLASVRNMEFSEVWQDMASGMVGMSRTLDKYGVNIRNVNMQQKLFDLGINANIESLNQNDKALLRTIIILDQTRYAWGDLSTTINQPTNQLRVLQNSFANLSRAIGTLFIGAISKALPYINGLVIAVQRLVTWLGSLIGVDLSKITGGIGGMESPISDMSDDLDNVNKGLGDATDNVKKLKKQLQGFDELNNLTTNDDSDKNKGGSSGIGASGGLLDKAFMDAVSEYQKAWDAAFEKMQNNAENIANKIEQAFAPIKEIIKDFAVGDFFKAGQDVSKLVVSITDFFARAIDKVDWKGIGKKIGQFLSGIDWKSILKSVGNLIWQALKAGIELWSGAFEEAPIETVLITAFALFKFTGLGSFVGGIISKAVVKGLATKLGVEIGANATVTSVISTKLGAKLATVSADASLMANAALIGTTIAASIVAAIAGFEIGKDIGKAIFPEDAEYYDNFSWFGEGGFFKTMGEEIKYMQEENRAIREQENQEWQEWSDNLSANFSSWYETDIKGVFNLWGKDIADWWNNKIRPWFTKDKWKELGRGMKEGLSNAWGDLKTWWNNTALVQWWNNDVKPWFTKEKWLGEFANINLAFNDVWNSISQGFNDFAEDINQFFDDVWKGVVGFWNDITSFGSGNKSTGNKGKSVPKYATGGFPEDGIFFANHSELVGKFSNGKTAVANNEQITDGIRQAARDGFIDAIQSVGGFGGSSNVNITLEGDAKGLFRTVKKEWSEEANRLQQNPVPVF